MRFLAASRLPDDDEHRKNYLYRVATNLARDRFRREKIEHDAEPMEPGVFRPRAEFGDAWTLLARLSPRDRELLVLAYVEEMSHKEIASVTGLMRASVKPLLFRARRRFAALLDAAGLTPADPPADRRSS